MPIRPLQVGDAVPDIVLRKLLQHPEPSVRLRQLQDQLVILDLMNTRCKSCVVHLLRLDTVQATYTDRLKIFAVSDEPAASVQDFLQRHPLGKRLRFPFATDDTLMRRLFPHQFISHLVWIYKGRVAAITKPEYVTAENVGAILQGRQPQLPVKKDLGTYDPSVPLLVPNQELLLPDNQSGFRYLSTLSPYLDGFSYGLTQYVDSTANVRRMTLVNYSITQLYLTACGKPTNFPAAFILLEVNDSSRFFFNRVGYRSDWYKRAFYCYQVAMPLQAGPALQKTKMLADLDAFLGLSGRMEKRFLKCTILKPDTATLAPVRPPGPVVQLRGVVSRINQLNGAPPCFLEIPDEEHWYVPQLPDLTDPEALAQALRPYGIRVTTRWQELDVLVIADRLPD